MLPMQLERATVCRMKLTLALLVILGCCLYCLALDNIDIVATKPPFLRSRYSLRWRRTTEPITNEIMVTSTDHPRAQGTAMATSTVGTDYDYYGNGEAENVVAKAQH